MSRNILDKKVEIPLLNWLDILSNINGRLARSIDIRSTDKRTLADKKLERVISLESLILNNFWKVAELRTCFAY